MSSRNIKTIPSHGVPVKPSLQTQEKEPSEFTQSAPTSQGSVSWLHSSISNKENKANEFNFQNDIPNFKKRKQLSFHIVSSYFYPLGAISAVIHCLLGIL